MHSKDLRNEVDGISRDISSLQARLNEKQAQLDALTYPVLSLPPEITSEIFIHCLPTWWSGVDAKVAPLLFLQICRRWREIVISTPALWTSLNLDVAVRKAHVADISRTWLERSRNRPFYVRFAGSIADIDDFVGFAENFARHAQRFNFMVLELSERDFQQLDVYHPEFSSLCKLVLRMETREQDEAPQGPFEMFSSAPLLEAVTLHGIPPALVALPWGQLKSFIGDLMRLSDCMEVLRLMPNLTTCTFSIFENADPHDTVVLSHPSMSLFVLRHGFQSSDDQEEACSLEILQFVHFPNLRVLRLEGVKDYETPALDSFIERGQLWMISKAFEQGRLSHLDLWYPSDGIVRIFLEQLASDEDFVPGLERLSVHCRKYRHFMGKIEPEVLLVIAAAPIARRRRLLGTTEFKSFLVFSQMPVKLKKEGMDIHINGLQEGLKLLK
ncbi:hypothetical protein FB45DRAFT_905387 [Roridomyces roridus]|uniref:F-box domain-containing protein n=1 Tax=Roridomyces roridus TaxID=1738132 RepID=A0AAD7FV50_9AGAR|nr:hypothetical protein FB45DRAFT_905387 [Roridomyces roridus]